MMEGLRAAGLEVLVDGSTLPDVPVASAVQSAGAGAATSRRIW